MSGSANPVSDRIVRNRSRSLLAALASIALGLATRRWPGLLPAAFGKYPGEALWALMAYFGWAAILPAATPGRLAALALGTAWAWSCSNSGRPPGSSTCATPPWATWSSATPSPGRTWWRKGWEWGWGSDLNFSTA